MNLNKSKITYLKIDKSLISTSNYISTDQKVYSIEISLDTKTLYILQSNEIVYQKVGKDLKQLKREAKKVLIKVFKVVFKDTVALEGKV